MSEPQPVYIYGGHMGTPDQKRKDMQAAANWHMLVTRLELPQDATVADVLARLTAAQPCTEAENYATDNDGADYRELPY